MADSVYYLPGHGGLLSKGLGEGLMDRGFDICGRETVGEFRALRFADQVELVAEDLRTECWHPHAQVIANSFGAYPTPMHCEIHVGARDWQSNPDHVRKLAALLDLPVTVVPDTGHMLGKEYVGQLLDGWLVKGGGGG